MDADAILQQITLIARDELDDDDLTLQMSSQATDVKGWDSIAHVKIVIALERAYGVRFETEQITSLKDVGDLVRLVQATVRR